MQWDLFAAGGRAPAPSPNPEPPRSAVDPAALSDAAILAAIPDAGMPLVLALIQEAGRRRLPAAIPVLGRLCQLFAGFGSNAKFRNRQLRSTRSLRSAGRTRDWSFLNCWIITEFKDRH